MSGGPFGSSSEHQRCAAGRINDLTLRGWSAKEVLWRPCQRDGERA